MAIPGPYYGVFTGEIATVGIYSVEGRSVSPFWRYTRACGHSGFPLGLISDSNFQNGGLNERRTVCGVGRLVAAA